MRSLRNAFLSFFSAKDPQQIDKKIDEIQVQLQGRENGGLPGHLGVMGICLMVCLDFLGIICRKYQEDKNTSRTCQDIKMIKVDKNEN